MRTRWMAFALLLGLAIVLALSLGPRIGTQNKRAGADSLVLRPGTYRAKWVIPKPNRHSMDNQKAGEVLLPRHQDTDRKTSPLPHIKGTLVMYSERNKIMFALDASGDRYDILRLDVNRNGSVSDEKAIKGVLQKDDLDPVGRFVFISAARMPLRELIPGTDDQNAVALDFYVEQVTPAVCYVDVRRRGCWTGTVASNKGPVPFRLLDSNMNGRCSDAWEMLGRRRHGGDMVVLDWSRKGDFHSPFGEYPEYRAASAPAEVFGRLVLLEPTISGDQLTVAPYDGPTGLVVIKTGKIGNCSVSAIRGTDFLTTLTGHSQAYIMPTDGRVLEIPAGEYRLDGVEVAPRSEESPNWTLTYDPGRPIAVESGKTSTVMVDGRIKMMAIPKEAVVTRRRGEATDIQVALILSDRGIVTIDEGEGFCRRGTGYMLPTVRMTDSQGNIMYKGGRIDWSDQYRCTLADYGTIPKTLKPGKYAYEIAFDAGPFGGVLKERKTIIVK